MSYLNLETQDAEHEERYGAEEQQGEVSYCNGCGSYLTSSQECDHEKRLKRPTELKTLICSCGSKTCSMIGVYGHVEPTYRAEIRPLATQYKRDARALELK